jgi:hypothetical protein
MSNQNKAIGFIFLMGFVVGAIFSSSGLMGFAGGFTAGVVFAKTYWSECPEGWVEVSGEQPSGIQSSLDFVTTLLKQKWDSIPWFHKTDKTSI